MEHPFLFAMIPPPGWENVHDIQLWKASWHPVFLLLLGNVICRPDLCYSVVLGHSVIFKGYAHAASFYITKWLSVQIVSNEDLY